MLNLCFFSCKNENTTQTNNEPTATNNTSSSNLTETKKYKGTLYYRYLADSEHLKAEAIFHSTAEKPKSKSISPTGSVIFQTKNMASRNFEKAGIRYSYAQTEAYKNKYTFTILDKVIPLEIAPIQNLQIKGDFKKSGDARLTWEGTPLEKDEQLVIMLSDNNNHSAPANIIGPSSSSATIILQNQLKRLDAGPVEIYVVRKKINNIDNHPELQGTITGEYYSKTISLTLED